LLQVCDFSCVYLLLQNSIPVWEDFNMKAGRMHAALRLNMTHILFFKHLGGRQT